MLKQDFERMLERVAKKAGVSKEQVCAEMQLAMEEGMRNPEPQVQERWQQIPRKGVAPTLEEFMEYLLQHF